MRIALLSFLVSVAAAFPPAPSSAGEPYPTTRPVVCECMADPVSGGASAALPLNCTISPSGGFGGSDPSDDIRVAVTVVNVLGSPIAGVDLVVTPTPLNGASFRWDDGSAPAGDLDERQQTGVTDAAGVAVFMFDEGGVAVPAGSAGLQNLDFHVTVDLPGPGGPEALPSCWDGPLRILDFALFAAEFGQGGSPADFNHSGGAVGVIDFSLFAANYGADIGNQ